MTKAHPAQRENGKRQDVWWRRGSPTGRGHKEKQSQRQPNVESVGRLIKATKARAKMKVRAAGSPCALIKAGKEGGKVRNKGEDTTREGQEQAYQQRHKHPTRQMLPPSTTTRRHRRNTTSTAHAQAWTADRPLEHILGEDTRLQHSRHRLSRTVHKDSTHRRYTRKPLAGACIAGA